jgi:hypothetical protein
MSPLVFRFDVVDRWHRGRLFHIFFRAQEAHDTALVLAGLYALSISDRASIDFASLRLLGGRSAIPDDFSRMRLERKPERTLRPGRIREYLRRGPMVCVLANNRIHGHGTARAGALLPTVTQVASEP